MITRFRPFAEAMSQEQLEALQAEMQVDKAFQAPQQTAVWAHFMCWLLGKEHIELWLERDEKGVLRTASWVYLYPLKWGRYWLYAARGPLLLPNQKDASALLAAVAAAHPKAVWLRWDPLFPGDGAQSWMPGAQKAHATFHPKSTLLVDLQQGEEAVFAQMKQKGRYNIRLAAKKEVRVMGWHYDARGQWCSMDLPEAAKKELSAEEAVDIYTKLSRETTSRDGFSGHGNEYFQAFLREMPENAFLLLAEAEGEIIAGGVFTLLDGLCTYYYGASSNRQREKMAPYLVQWTAMRYALSQGAHTYDFLGVATPDSTDPGDLALSGVTDFKTKFGGQILTRGKSWEKILQPQWFLSVRLLKSLRRILSRARRS